MTGVAKSRPGRWFWLASFAVFLANAVLSAARRQWLLAVAQVVTALMAALSAGASMEASTDRRAGTAANHGHLPPGDEIPSPQGA